MRARLGTAHHTGIDALIAASRELRRDRELAFYGTEDLTPSEFYSKKDAERALTFARESVDFVSRVIDGT